MGNQVIRVNLISKRLTTLQKVSLKFLSWEVLNTSPGLYTKCRRTRSRSRLKSTTNTSETVACPPIVTRQHETNRMIAGEDVTR